MSRFVVRGVASALAVSGMALVLAGCGGGGQSTTDGSQSPRETPSATADQATPTPSATADQATPTPSATADQPGTAVSAALKSYVAGERATIPGIQAQNPGVYSEISVTAVAPDTVSYTFVYETQRDASAAATYFEGMIPTFQTACDTQVFPAMAAEGVTPTQTVIYTYINTDGAVLWTHTFTSS